MKFLQYLILFLVSANLYSQNVGINTVLPRADLDVNGTINVNNEIHLGGTDASVGSAGTPGDLLSGNGTGNTQWKNFDLPAGYGDVVLTNSYVGSADNGITINGTNNSTALSIPYNANQNMVTPKAWQLIDDITTDFTISKPTNISNIAIQTMVQINTGLQGSFGCGIFIDDQLKTVRTGVVSGGVGSYISFNVNTSLINLPVGFHTLKFGCVERFVPTGTSLSIGQPIINNLNADMSKTSYDISVLESGN